MAYDYGTQPEPINKVLEAVDLASVLVPADKLMLGISLASEDSSSIVSKVAIAQRYNLKGIAIWRLGLVPDDAWTNLREINSPK
jgi:spore germination protein YaaH